MMKQSILILAFLCCCSWLTAQNAGDLRAKRKRLEQEISRTTEQLQHTREERSAAMQQLQLLEREVEQRRDLIETLNQELELLGQGLAFNEDLVQSLSGDLDRMRLEYAETLRAAYRSKLTGSWAGFLFSATGFNDAFRRFQYLRQYQRYRRRQGQLILQTRDLLEEKSMELQVQQQENEMLLLAARDQDIELEQTLSTQSSLVDQLSSEERKLYGRVAQKQKEQAALDKAIEQAIAAEIAARERREKAKAAKKASAATTTTTTTGSTTVPAATGKATAIAGQKGALPWPVKGTIVKKFGNQPHPDVPSVSIFNGGVDIEAGAEARVQCIYAGEVVSIRPVPGYRQMLMIRHGDYYTVYSNIDRILVAEGDEVEAGATLGFTDQSGAPLHFEFWHGKERENPSRWLQR